MAKEDSIIRV